jgi:hypothetical protein
MGTLGFNLLNGGRPNEGTIKFGVWCLKGVSFYWILFWLCISGYTRTMTTIRSFDTVHSLENYSRRCIWSYSFIFASKQVYACSVRFLSAIQLYPCLINKLDIQLPITTRVRGIVTLFHVFPSVSNEATQAVVRHKLFRDRVNATNTCLNQRLSYPLRQTKWNPA